MKVNCLKCGKPVQLLREAVSNYAWQCPDHCLTSVDTGVPVTEGIAEFEKQLTGSLPHLLVVTPPLPASRIAGAKVYAPHILTHFIECTWAGCYNSIYQVFLVPHFDSAPVLDYVLRTPAVQVDPVLEDGIPTPRMFPRRASSSTLPSASRPKLVAVSFHWSARRLDKAVL